jgi:hypothetical protein
MDKYIVAHLARPVADRSQGWYIVENDDVGKGKEFKRTIGCGPGKPAHGHCIVYPPFRWLEPIFGLKLCYLQFTSWPSDGYCTKPEKLSIACVEAFGNVELFADFYGTSNVLYINRTLHGTVFISTLVTILHVPN